MSRLTEHIEEDFSLNNEDEDFPPSATRAIVGGGGIWAIIIGFILLFLVFYIGIVLVAVGSLVLGCLWLTDKMVHFWNHYDEDR